MIEIAFQKRFLLSWDFTVFTNFGRLHPPSRHKYSNDQKCWPHQILKQNFRIFGVRLTSEAP